MKIVKPVFIIACPRSGSSYLLKILSESKELWSSYRESHYLWESFLEDPRDPIFSMALDVGDYEAAVSDNGFTPEIFEALYHLNTFNHALLGQISRVVSFREKVKPLFNWFLDLNKLWKEEILNLGDYRIVDKTPPNVFRVEFLDKVFPDAQFLYLKRSPEGNVNSLMKAWQSKGKLFDFKFREFYEYNSRINFEGYDGKVWKFINPPGWERFLDDGAYSNSKESGLGRTDSRLLSLSERSVAELREHQESSSNVGDGAYSNSKDSGLGRTDSRLLSLSERSVAELREHQESSSNAEDGVISHSLREVCEFQYDMANKYASESLAKISSRLSEAARSKKVLEINYEDMIEDKAKSFAEICDFLDLDFSIGMQSMIAKDPKVSQVKD